MEKMMFYYDEERDVLDISIDRPKKAKSEEIGNDIIVRKDEKGNVVGFTILNFEKRAEVEKGFIVNPQKNPDMHCGFTYSSQGSNIQIDSLENYNIPIEAKFGVSS